MGPAVAISMLFTIASALTLAPAILTLGSLFGLFDPAARAAKSRLLVPPYRHERGALAQAHGL